MTQELYFSIYPSRFFCAMFTGMEAALYLVPVPLGEGLIENVIPRGNIEMIKNMRDFIVESRKSAVRFLKKVDANFDIDSCSFRELSEHTDPAEISDCLDPILKRGRPVGVISDAGCPAVADPGSEAVKLAHQKNVRVVPLAGPSSILMSLMASGFSGQSFSFNGYLPAKPGEREAKLRFLESRAYREAQTQIFIETPYRNVKMFESILRTLKKETRLCVASGITCAEEFIRTMTISEWKKAPVPEIAKIPAIFLISG